MGYLDPLLSFFKFTQDTDIVAAACLVLMLASVVGGMLANILRAFGGPLKPIPFSQTNGFRILLFYELCLIAVMFYYHAMVVGRISAVQGVFWVTTMMSVPVLWFIGATTTHVIFWAKIAARKKAYKEEVARKKFAKHQKLRQQIRQETRDTKEAQQERASLTAKGLKGHQATVKRRPAEG